MAIKNLDDKFMHGLADLYDAEHQFLEAQREMAPKSKSDQLKRLIREHIDQTEQQIGNLEQVFEMLGERPKRIKCKGAAGLVAEGTKGLEETTGYPAVRDTVICEAAEKVEHYEIVSYQGLIHEADALGHANVVPLLRQNLQQEEHAAQKLEETGPKLLEAAQRNRR